MASKTEGTQPAASCLSFLLFPTGRFLFSLLLLRQTGREDWKRDVCISLIIPTLHTCCGGTKGGLELYFREERNPGHAPRTNMDDCILMRLWHSSHHPRDHPTSPNRRPSSPPSWQAGAGRSASDASDRGRQAVSLRHAAACSSGAPSLSRSRSRSATHLPAAVCRHDAA